MKQKQYFLALLFIAFVTRSPLAGAQVIKTFAGMGTNGYSGDNGLPIYAKLNGCSGVAVDGEGNVYIADQENNVVRMVSSLTGIITTFAGKDSAGYSGDGAKATYAKLNQPYSLVTDADDNVYIADYGNNVIRVVSSSSGFINTYAGNGVAGYYGDGSLANHAELNGPISIAMDGSNNLYIADVNNNVIREVSSGGIITTIAGNNTAGYSGDNGSPTAAQLNSPSGVAVDVYGDVFIADKLNNVVREVVDSTGMITTMAGNNTSGHAGDGAPAISAQLSYPSGVSLDQAGNVYIADRGNSAIRMVDSSGTISRFAGSYSPGYAGDNGLAANAELSSPISVTADGWGRIYIADFGNNVIRIVTQGNAGVAAISTSPGIKVYPNPSDGLVTVEIPGTVNNAVITVTDVLGNVVVTANSNIQNTVLNLGNVPAGSYQVKVLNGGKTYSNKIEVVR